MLQCLFCTKCYINKVQLPPQSSAMHNLHMLGKVCTKQTSGEQDLKAVYLIKKWPHIQYCDFDNIVINCAALILES